MRDDNFLDERSQLLGLQFCDSVKKKTSVKRKKNTILDDVVFLC